MTTLPLMQITMLATSTDQYQQPNSFSVDTDGVCFIIDNSANSGVCNIKSIFVRNYERHRVTLVTAYGRITTKKLVGTICLVLKDDEGKPWSYDIPDVVYDQESPYSLLSIPFLGKYFARNDEATKFDEQTWIQSTSTSFCTCISTYADDKISFAFSLAFTTSPDGIPQPHTIPNDDNDEMDEVKWYTPAHVCQNEQSNKRVHLSKSTKKPKPILHETPEIEFKLGMNIIFKDGTGKSVHVGYKGATANGLKHVIRQIDSS
jgi:hypothetical protein